MTNTAAAAAALTIPADRIRQARKIVAIADLAKEGTLDAAFLDVMFEQVADIAAALGITGSVFAVADQLAAALYV
jgi:hypothetical protein